MKLCLEDNRIADNTEPSLTTRSQEGVETMYLPSLSMGDEDIVRSAWRHAESGRNGLTLLRLFGVPLKASQFSDNLINASLFSVRVLTASLMHHSEEFPKRLQFLTFPCRKNTFTQDTIDIPNFLLGYNCPISHWQFSVATWLDIVEYVATQVLLNIEQDLVIIASDRDSQFGAEAAAPDSITNLIVVMDLNTSFTPEESAEFGFPQSISNHKCTSISLIIPHLRYDYKRVTTKDTTYDLEGDTNITNVWVTGGGLGKAGDYFGATFKDLPLGFRYYESSIVPISRASGYGDVYNTFVLGEEAYGTVKLESMPAKIITHMPGTSGVSDPLDQVGTIGWKANWAAVILNQNNLVLIKHQTSAYTGTRAGL